VLRGYGAITPQNGRCELFGQLNEIKFFLVRQRAAHQFGAGPVKLMLLTLFNIRLVEPD